MKPIDRFNEEQVRALIARAIELDVHGRTTSADDVRAIATELGISADAVDAALREQSAIVPALTERDRSPAVVAGSIVLGVVAGTMVSTTMPHVFAGSMGLMGLSGIGFLCSGLMLVVRGRNITIPSFLRRNFLVWAGLTAGSMAAAGLFGSFPALPAIFLSLCVRGWVTSSVLGSAAVMAIRGAVAPGDAGGMSTGGRAGQSLRVRLLGAARRVVDWFSHVLRREVIRLSIATRSGQ